MTNDPVIGFIGLGLMGQGMATNLRKAGFELWVKGGTTRKPVDALLALGAHEAASPREMAARCDIIHLCLPNSQVIEETMAGPNGILAGGRPGLVVIDASTANPSSTLRIASDLEQAGGVFVDAPLGGTPAQADTGQLTAMVGCDEALLDSISPVISAWASTITRIGPVGSGHKMKLIMNFIGLTYGSLFSEVVVLAAKVGIAPALLREVIAPGRMGSGFFDTFMAYVVDRDRDAHKFTIANAAKDLRYINQMASEAGVMNIVAGAAMHYYTHVEAQGGGDKYVPMLSDAVAALNAFSLDPQPT
jgi:3-hydroxyisobutyrate dehydrogenase-like beta-hydroxyacid dehydrogenase